MVPRHTHAKKSGIFKNVGTSAKEYHGRGMHLLAMIGPLQVTASWHARVTRVWKIIQCTYLSPHHRSSDNVQMFFFYGRTITSHQRSRKFQSPAGPLHQACASRYIRLQNVAAMWPFFNKKAFGHYLKIRGVLENLYTDLWYFQSPDGCCSSTRYPPAFFRNPYYGMTFVSEEPPNTPRDHPYWVWKSSGVFRYYSDPARKQSLYWANHKPQRNAPQSYVYTCRAGNAPAADDWPITGDSWLVGSATPDSEECTLPSSSLLIGMSSGIFGS